MVKPQDWKNVLSSTRFFFHSATAYTNVSKVAREFSFSKTLFTFFSQVSKKDFFIWLAPGIMMLIHIHTDKKTSQVLSEREKENRQGKWKHNNEMHSQFSSPFFSSLSLSLQKITLGKTRFTYNIWAYFLSLFSFLSFFPTTKKPATSVQRPIIRRQVVRT